ncbi:hypothetical protein Bp8pS_295 [Bacillus phage vB_BpuM-BpSp]|nr:hypothetical protein Bp8pS_295 [Bacillus phage vB_BpuM-BpSp]
MNLYEKHNYTNKNILYLKNNIVYEYDMVNAGINILFHNNVLNKQQVDRLNNMEKLEKNITVGKFLKKNKSINDGLIKEFINIRKHLFELNNIENKDVLSIKKDAIFLINKELEHLELNENYKFQEKNKYTAFIQINNKEFFYDPKKEEFDIKGFSKNIKDHHVNFLFKELREIMLLDMNNNSREVFERLLTLKYEFLEKQLDKGYYLDIQQGNYIIKLNDTFTYSLENINKETIKHCLIDNNLNFIVNMIKILVS